MAGLLRPPSERCEIGRRSPLGLNLTVGSISDTVIRVGVVDVAALAHYVFVRDDFI
ncbi:MAG: hypothetical protein M1126_01795 [Candidatus Thermoplasmatota archaeon]|nr:hypothetical protein [Candidatus Thermoplasmatota archaeon]